MRIFVDKMVLDQSPRRTSDGYLVAMPRIARQGIQEYLAVELGLTDREPDTPIKIYRPEEEVFHPDSLHSMAHRPVTVDHPNVHVDASNWKEFAVGQTGGEVVRDGEFIRVPMSLMDAAAIQDVEGGKVELSVGYTADLDWTAGTTPDGQHYDAVQRNIRGNHLAIVDAARGGSMLRVIDSTPPKEDIPMRKITVDGVSVEVNDTGYEVLQKFMKDEEEKVKSAMDRLKDMEEEMDKLKADLKSKDEETKTKDAEITTLKSQLDGAKMTPEKLDDAVKARSAVIDSARKLKADVVVDGKTEAEIRRSIVSEKLGDVAKDWTDEQVTASFNTLASASPATDPYRDANISRTTQTNDGQLRGRDLYLDRLAHPEKYTQKEVH